MSEISVGSEIAGLRIEEVAGRGGSSIVYRATDLRSGRPRAAKVLRAADPESRRRLQREAALLSRIDHPAIIPFRRLHQTDEQAILITDWVDGQSLLERHRLAGPITPAEALGVLYALADPLDHLHTQGVVHRDISPANLIVTPDGTLMVIDLGIGHDVESSTVTDHDMTDHDTVAGTPSYLAPEVIRGEPATGASDQYSVAVLLHELLTGRSPFPASTEVAAALRHQLSSEPEPLQGIDPAIPTELSEAVLRALAKDPEDRFDSMADFATAADPGMADVGTRRSRRGPVLSAAAALAIGAAFVGLVYWLAVDQRSDGDAGDDPTEALAATAAQADRPAGDTGRWSEGTAAALGCNLLTGGGFEDGSVPVDHFAEPPDPDRVVERGGFEDSRALEVGRPDRPGRWGEMVDIETDRGYVFRGWFDIVDAIEAARLGIIFLDDRLQLVGDAVSGPIPADSAGFQEIRVDKPPAGAARAVPFLIKERRAGVLLADELVFGPTDLCDAEFNRATG